MTEDSQKDEVLGNDEIVDRIRDDAVDEIEQIGMTMPNLKAQLIKWAVRSIIAYGLARAVMMWRGGPEWLMPVTYLYIVISLILAVAMWLVSRRMIERSRRVVEQKTEELRTTLDQMDNDEVNQ